MAPVRVRVAEKYVNQRTASFTRTHAVAMQEWKSAHGGSEDGYYEAFRANVARADARYHRELAAIEADINTSYSEKRVLRGRLRTVYPAWTMEQEQKFIEVYGDPREGDRGTLMALLEGLKGPTWEDAMRGGELRRVEKQPWELKFYEALVNPQDGSVPLMLDAATIPPAMGGSPPAGDSRGTPRPQLESPAAVSDNPEIQKMAEAFVKNICPVCLKPQKKLNSVHVEACRRKHNDID